MRHSRILKIPFRTFSRTFFIRKSHSPVRHTKIPNVSSIHLVQFLHVIVYYGSFLNFKLTSVTQITLNNPVTFPSHNKNQLS